MKGKKNKVLLIITIMIGVIAVISYYFCSQTNEKVECVMTVGDMQVSRNEVEIVIDQLEYRHKNNLINTYNIPEENFHWDESYGDQKAYQYLMDDMLNQITKIKTIQMLACEEGILDKFDYDIFLKMWERENEERSHKIANGEVVYGLKNFSKTQYYDYLNNNLMLSLKNILIKSNKVSASDSEINDVYETNKSYFNNLKFEEVKESVKNLCYENKINSYIEEKMEEVQLDYDKESLKKEVKEMIN